MTKKKLRIVHYLNQFFGQIGGEDKADVGLSVKEGPVGPGVLLQKLIGEDGAVVATVICGDNNFAANLERASEEALKLIEPYKPDILFAGPAFAAGRYGLNCGEICKRVGGKLGIPAITGMYQENPGMDIYRKDCYIAKTGNSAAKMSEAVTRMVNIARKIVSPEQEPQGDRGGPDREACRGRVLPEGGAPKRADGENDRLPRRGHAPFQDPGEAVPERSGDAEIRAHTAPTGGEGHEAL